MFGLTWVDGHAHSSIPTVALITDTEVLVWTSVDTRGLGMTHLLETRVYGCGGGAEHTKIVTFNVLFKKQPNNLETMS